MTSPEDISRIAAAFAEVRRRQQSARLGRAAGVDAATGALFRALDALEAEPLSITELALRVGVDQPRASRLAADAVRRGLATRRVDPSDARRSVLELTRTGRAMVDAARANRSAAVATALAGFDETEKRAFADLLERFLAGWPD